MNSKLSTVCCLLLTAAAATAGWYPPEAGQPGTTAISKDSPLFVNWANGHSNYSPGYSVEAVWQTPANAYGKPEGDIFTIACLGNGGSITMVFPHPICDGPGADFAVFENSFSDYNLELAFVEVSSDGVNFVRFQVWSFTDEEVGAYAVAAMNPTDIEGFAGKYRAGFGTPFDLAALSASATLDPQQIRFVRIVDIVGDGGTFDSLWQPIYDPTPTYGSGGFDLDGIGVIHQNAGPLQLASAQITPQGFTLTWDSNPGSTYQIMESTDLKTWQLARTVPGNLTGTTTQTVMPMTGSPAKFWQVARP